MTIIMQIYTLLLYNFIAIMSSKIHVKPRESIFEKENLCSSLPARYLCHFVIPHHWGRIRTASILTQFRGKVCPKNVR